MSFLMLDLPKGSLSISLLLSMLGFEGELGICAPDCNAFGLEDTNDIAGFAEEAIDAFLTAISCSCKLWLVKMAAGWLMLPPGDWWSWNI